MHYLLLAGTAQYASFRFKRIIQRNCSLDKWKMRFKSVPPVVVEFMFALRTTLLSSIAAAALVCNVASDAATDGQNKYPAVTWGILGVSGIGRYQIV